LGELDETGLCGDWGLDTGSTRELEGRASVSSDDLLLPKVEFTLLGVLLSCMALLVRLALPVLEVAGLEVVDALSAWVELEVGGWELEATVVVELTPLLLVLIIAWVLGGRAAV